MPEKLRNLAEHLLQEGHASDMPDALAKAVRLRMALEAAGPAPDAPPNDAE